MEGITVELAATGEQAKASMSNSFGHPQSICGVCTMKHEHLCSFVSLQIFEQSVTHACHRRLLQKDGMKRSQSVAQDTAFRRIG